MKNGILVIEMYERDICSVTLCDTMDEAVDTANELLEARMNECRRTDDFESGEDEESEWQRASESNLNAWCNYSGNWDAHIVQF